MEPEVGKRYMTREGKITGPLMSYDDPYYPFKCQKLNATWNKFGKLIDQSCAAHSYDLVSEYVEETTKSEPVSEVLDCLVFVESISGKVCIVMPDLTKLETGIFLEKKWVKK